MTDVVTQAKIAEWNNTAISIISTYIDKKAETIPGQDERNGWKSRAIAATRAKLDALTAAGQYAWATDDSLAQRTPPIDPNFALQTQLRAFDIGIPTHQLMIMLTSADWIRPTEVPMDASKHTVRMDAVAGLVPIKGAIDINPDRDVGVADIFDGVDPFTLIQDMMHTVLQDAYVPGDVLALTGPARRKSSVIGKVYLNAVQELFGQATKQYLDCSCCRNFLFHMGSLVALRRDDNGVARIHSLLWDLDAAGIDRDEVHPAIQKFFDTMRDHVVQRSPRTLLSRAHVATLSITTAHNRDAGEYVIGSPIEGHAHDGTPFPHLHITLSEKMLTKYDLSSFGCGGTYGELIEHARSVAKEKWMDPKHLLKVITRLTGRPALEKFISTDGLFWWKGVAELTRQSSVVNLWADMLIRIAEVANPTVLSLRTKLSGTFIKNSYPGQDKDAEDADTTFENAFRSFFKAADSRDYMRASEEASAERIAVAGKFLEENDYLRSFERRPASIKDLDQYLKVYYKAPETAEEASEETPNTSALAVVNRLSKTAPESDKDFDPIAVTMGSPVEMMSYKEFHEKYADQVDRMWVTARPLPLFISLTSAVHTDAKPIFKWDHGNLPIAWYFIDIEKRRSSNAQYGMTRQFAEVERVYASDFGETMGPKAILILKDVHTPRDIVERGGVMIFAQTLIPAISSRADYRQVVETLSKSIMQNQTEVDYLHDATGYELNASSSETMPVTLIARLKTGVCVRVSLIKA